MHMGEAACIVALLMVIASIVGAVTRRSLDGARAGAA